MGDKKFIIEVQKNVPVTPKHQMLRCLLFFNLHDSKCTVHNIADVPDLGGGLIFNALMSIRGVWIQSSGRGAGNPPPPAPSPPSGHGRGEGAKKRHRKVSHSFHLNLFEIYA